MLDVHRTSPAIRSYYWSGPLVAVAAQLIGPNIKCAAATLRCRLAGHERESAWRQANGGAEELDPYNAVTAIMALDDVDAENGCVWVVPGSHAARGQLAADGRSGGGDARIDGGVAVPLRAGETLLLHCHTLHAYGGNASAVRDVRFLQLRYADADAVERGSPACPPRLGRLLRGETVFPSVSRCEAGRAEDVARRAAFRPAPRLPSRALREVRLGAAAALANLAARALAHAALGRRGSGRAPLGAWARDSVALAWALLGFRAARAALEPACGALLLRAPGTGGWAARGASGAEARAARLGGAALAAALAAPLLWRDAQRSWRRVATLAVLTRGFSALATPSALLLGAASAHLCFAFIVHPQSLHPSTLRLFLRQSGVHRDAHALLHARARKSRYRDSVPAHVARNALALVDAPPGGARAFVGAASEKLSRAQEAALPSYRALVVPRAGHRRDVVAALDRRAPAALRGGVLLFARAFPRALRYYAPPHVALFLVRFARARARRIRAEGAETRLGGAAAASGRGSATRAPRPAVELLVARIVRSALFLALYTLGVQWLPELLRAVAAPRALDPPPWAFPCVPRFASPPRAACWRSAGRPHPGRALVSPPRRRGCVLTPLARTPRSRAHLTHSLAHALRATAAPRTQARRVDRLARRGASRVARRRWRALPVDRRARRDERGAHRRGSRVAAPLRRGSRAAPPALASTRAAERL